MKPQSYSNHRKFYYPHHFIFYPVCLILCIICIERYTETIFLKQMYMLFATTFMLLIWLSFMMRQHYSLKTQDRIIRLELRLRYFQITGERLEPLEDKLKFGQLAALRFASDEEFLILLDRAGKENLSASEIKKSIKNWQPDYMRV